MAKIASQEDLDDILEQGKFDGNGALICEFIANHENNGGIEVNANS